MRSVTIHRGLTKWLAIAAGAIAVLMGASSAAGDLTDPGNLIVRIPDYDSDAPTLPLPVAAAPAIGQLHSRFPTITGAGQTVAVIDTGVDHTHPALAGQYRGGYDFVNHDSNPMDDHGHGTHVAGIIAADSGTYPGLAPGAGIVALKVLDASGAGTFNDVIDALQWVIDHRAEHNITAVNMSLSAGNYASAPAYAPMDSRLAQLRSAGVFVSVAAGNSFYGDDSQLGLGYPAAAVDAISVGNAWAGNFGRVYWSGGARDYSTGEGRVVSHSQRSDDLDLLAPGALITSTRKGGGYTTMGGTSMAAPYAAASAVLARQAFEETYGRPPTVDELLDVLTQAGQAMLDGDDEDDNVVNSGLTFFLLDPDAALDSMLEPTPVPEPATCTFLSLGGVVLIVALRARQRQRSA